MRPPWQSRGGPATPFPRRAAETAASPRQMEPPALLVSLLRAEKRWSERWRWDWPPAPGPHHRCQEKAETPARPCWEGAGPEQVQPQPLDPLCQHLSGGARALFLSSLLLIHTLERCCGATSSPPSLHPATNPDTKNSQPDAALLPPRVFPLKGTEIKGTKFKVQ